MVGGLVEQQHVGHGHQGLGQGHALLHAARQLADLAAAVQVQLGQGGFHALLPVPGVQGLDAGLQGVQVDAVGMVFIGLAHRTGLGHALADGLEHGVAGLEHRLLWHVADAQALGHLQQAVVELLQPGHHLQQAGLAGAVAADQSQAFTGLQRQAGGIEQGDMAVSEVGVRKREQSHGRIVAGRTGMAGLALVPGGGGGFW